MNTEIITIGDELLIGQVIDTNSPWMAQQLGNHGFQVVKKTTVGDIESDILHALDNALTNAPIVLLTGGLGPTNDDITRNALCQYFHCQLHFDNNIFQTISDVFQHSGHTMNELTRNQAMVPDNATPLPNRVGTAPGLWFERNNRAAISLPGVPNEMQWLMTHEVLPRLKTRFPSHLAIRHHTLAVSGLAESQLALLLVQFEAELPTCVKLAYLPGNGLIRLRLSARADTNEQADNALAKQTRKLRALLSQHLLPSPNP